LHVNGRLDRFGEIVAENAGPSAADENALRLSRAGGRVIWFERLFASKTRLELTRLELLRGRRARANTTDLAPAEQTTRDRTVGALPSHGLEPLTPSPYHWGLVKLLSDHAPVEATIRAGVRRVPEAML